ncbi:hypothetical protein HRbin25_00638 [bacterium HR25]|jgi:uncharacterized OsmC-like protein|nr:hypothetical protein HRbin25_00638 [bacterium HR25]
MTEELIVNRVRSYSTGTPGRSLSQARNHHLVIDEPAYGGGPGEEITPAEAFLAGVSACGVLLLESFARQAGVPFQRAEVEIEGVRSRTDPSLFRQVNMRFHLVGPSRAQAEELVAAYQRR